MAVLTLGCGQGDEGTELVAGGGAEADSASGGGAEVVGVSAGGSGEGTGGQNATGSDGGSGSEELPVGPVTTEPAGPLTLNIEIAPEELARLEAEPWLAPDVPGAFVDGGGMRFEGIGLNYRGAYQLRNLIRFAEVRNWKLKFTKAAPYLARREWNLNYEPHLRQKMAYDLLKAADVRVPSAEHVLLKVNGETQGVYLRYADPDSKGWVQDAFGSDKGDLFKAAYDIPDEEPFFATMEVLGTSDEEYFLHYNKKLNNNDEAATDFSSLRAFISGINESSDEDFAGWLSTNFDVERFTSYLVVSSFICNWDSYPYRPKNYWLYQHPESRVWSFIPWDLDATFFVGPGFNYPLPADSSIFQEFGQFEGLSRAADAEGTERPLVRRMMAVSAFRDAYVARYRELTSSLLSEASLKSRAQILQDELLTFAPATDQEELSESYDSLIEFVEIRTLAVSDELAGL